MPPMPRPGPRCVTAEHQAQQEAGRVDERGATSGPGPVDDPRSPGVHEHVERVEVGVQQRVTGQQVSGRVVVKVGRPPLLSLLDREIGARDLLQSVEDVDDCRQVGRAGCVVGVPCAGDVVEGQEVPSGALVCQRSRGATGSTQGLIIASRCWRTTPG